VSASGRPRLNLYFEELSTSNEDTRGLIAIAF